MKTAIWVTFQVKGIHRWKDAKNYLRHPHRHMFHFRVETSVTHDDREIEFIDLKEDLMDVASTRIFPGWTVTTSCEAAAKEMVAYLKANYGDRDYTVEVSEDGENGAKVSCNCSTRR